MRLWCAYTPTAKAPPGMKYGFKPDLQDTQDKIPQNDVFLLLGDFNTKVGLLKQGDHM